MVCDTPPDMEVASSCGVNSCDTDTDSSSSNGFFTTDVLDMGSNFMDYGNLACVNDFTMGQSERMIFHLENYRVNLYTQAPSNNDVCTALCSGISVSFTDDVLYPLVGNLINFTSDATGITNYEWYIELLGSTRPNYSVAWETGYVPSTSVVATTSNLMYTFPSEGKYRVYLKAWDNSDPFCFTSYSSIMNIICGVDARFWPNKREIAAKESLAKFQDTVTFKNRSFGATDYEWMVEHTPTDLPPGGITQGPPLPTFVSSDVDLKYIFRDPGTYNITLTARSSTCSDTSGPFELPVIDPTMDGTISIQGVVCFNNDSLRVIMSVYNAGYDTINVGTPASFYDEDPRLTTTNPTLLKTYYLEDTVFFEEAEMFTLFVKVNKPKLDQLYVVFNDPGTTTFPIDFPEGDRNVLSSSSLYPASGENELTYSNNFNSKSDFQFKLDLQPLEAVVCPDTDYQFDAKSINDSGQTVPNWIPNTNLSCTDCLNPILTISEDMSQQLIITSKHLCYDSATAEIKIYMLDASSKSYETISDQPLEMDLDVTFTPSTDPPTLTWKDESGQVIGTGNSIIVRPTVPTTYTIEIAHPLIGCIIEKEIDVDIISALETTKIFSPNGDGLNDFWHIGSIEKFPKAKIVVYDRWEKSFLKKWDTQTIGMEKSMAIRLLWEPTTM